MTAFERNAIAQLQPHLPQANEVLAGKERSQLLGYDYLIPRGIARRLVEPEKYQITEGGREALLRIGTPENAAHAFHLLPRGRDLSQKSDNRSLLSEDWLRACTMIADFFNDNWPLGFVLKTRPDSVKGFLTTDMTGSLEDTLGAIGPFMDKLQALRFCMPLWLVSDQRGTQLLARSIGSRLIIDDPQAGPYTTLALAARGLQMPGNRDFLNNIPANQIVWVSSSIQEQLREQGLGVFDPGITDKRPVPVVSDPRKANTRTFVRVLERRHSVGKVPVIEGKDAKSDTTPIERQYTESIMQFLDTYYKPEGEQHESWRDELKERGIVKVAFSGDQVTLKWDYSGMSKLVARNLDPGKLMYELFDSIMVRMGGYLEGHNYLLTPEGDGIGMVLFMDDLSSADNIKRLVSMQRAANRAFLDFMGKHLKAGDFKDELAEHAVGLKMFAKVSDARAAKPQEDSSNDITIGVVKGSFIIIDDKFTELEESGEKKAKTGGYAATFFFENRLTPEEQLTVFEGRKVLEEEIEGGYIYRVASQTMLDHVFGSIIMDFALDNPQFIDEIAQQFSDYVSRNRDQQNNHLAAAKILYTLKKMKSSEKHSQAYALVREKMEEMFSARGFVWLEKTMNAYELGRNEVDDNDSDSLQVLDILSELESQQEGAKA